MIKRILLATDFSTVTRRAEDYALELAKAQHAEVTLLHAIETVEGAEGNSSLEAFFEARRAKAQSESDAIAERFRSEDVKCNVRIENGKRWKVITDVATEQQYDLVILGSHKIHDGNKVYLGTTTHKVFFSADVPLLVVPT